MGWGRSVGSADLCTGRPVEAFGCWLVEEVEGCGGVAGAGVLLLGVLASHALAGWRGCEDVGCAAGV